MKKLLFTFSICLLVFVVSAQPASKKHGLIHKKSSVEYTASSNGHSLTTKKHWQSSNEYNASSDGHSLATKKHGHSGIIFTASSNGHSLASKKHGHSNTRFEEEPSLAQNLENNTLDDR
ncbi:hypothetical protein [Mangrovibacterium lignilyticum]|uniref:hypothetical protein n=1 Tax=Mangrovibacterium lignilyticum TaxID=2668052 RepID=UPI0013D11D3B|nr:hypothetical protein [Mangrovibacterium lignilyticum]